MTTPRPATARASQRAMRTRDARSQAAATAAAGRANGHIRCQHTHMGTANRVFELAKNRARSARRSHERPGCANGARRELAVDMRGAEGERARVKNDTAVSCAQTRQTIKRECHPHLIGLPRTGSGEGPSKQMQTHLNFVGPQSMRFGRVRLMQQLGRCAS